jgi:hypothetical protein
MTSRAPRNLRGARFLCAGKFPPVGSACAHSDLQYEKALKWINDH